MNCLAPCTAGELRSSQFAPFVKSSVPRLTAFGPAGRYWYRWPSSPPAEWPFFTCTRSPFETD